jgi:hypothetical protein
MNRIEMVKRLVNEGLSQKTLVNFTDKQLKSLCERMVSEQVTPIPPKQPALKIGPKGGELPPNPKGYTISQNPNDKTIIAVTKETEMKEGKKKPTQKQLSALDKNKNKKIDKQDFEILRKEKTSKKSEVKESKKSGKLDQKSKLSMTLKKLKENNEISEWVNNLAETNYHPFTSKGEIMELLKRKLNEQETETPTIAPPKPTERPKPKTPYEPGPGTDTKPKAGHNGIPEFMTYDSIMSSTKEKELPTIAPPKPTERPKPKTPYEPGPGTDTKPKAGIKKIQERKK